MFTICLLIHHFLNYGLILIGKIMFTTIVKSFLNCCFLSQKNRGPVPPTPDKPLLDQSDSISVSTESKLAELRYPRLASGKTSANMCPHYDCTIIQANSLKLCRQPFCPSHCYLTSTKFVHRCVSLPNFNKGKQRYTKV